MIRTELKQSVEYVSYFASLGAAAVLSWVVWEMTESPMAYSEANAQTELVQNSNQWVSLLVENLPVVFIGIASMGALAITVYRSNYV